MGVKRKLKAGDILGRKLSNKKAAMADAEFKKILTQHGRITPSAVVNWARPASNPLHEYFEWNKNKAHERYLLDQAQRLIQEVSIIVMNVKKKPVRVRAWVSTVDRHGRHYSPIIPVLSKKETRDQLLAEALQALEHLRKKYEILSELAEVFESAQRVSKKLKKAA
jgi:hypothetical protein